MFLESDATQRPELAATRRLLRDSWFLLAVLVCRQLVTICRSGPATLGGLVCSHVSTFCGLTLGYEATNQTCCASGFARPRLFLIGVSQPNSMKRTVTSTPSRPGQALCLPRFTASLRLPRGRFRTSFHGLTDLLSCSILVSLLLF